MDKVLVTSTPFTDMRYGADKFRALRFKGVVFDYHKRARALPRYIHQGELITERVLIDLAVPVITKRTGSGCMISK